MPPERKRQRISGLTGAECTEAELAIKGLLRKSRQDQALNTEEGDYVSREAGRHSPMAAIQS